MNVHTQSLAAVDRREIRRFVEILHEHAAIAFNGVADPGLIQLVRLWPDDRSPTIVCGRFKIGAVDAMAEAAAIEAEAGHNVYVEGRTVRSDMTGPKRGSLMDARGVFALVVDDDPEKGKGADLGEIEPSLCIETSPRNRHHWLFLERALPADDAQRVGARLRATTRGDDNTGNSTQPYRVAGTPNYPGPKKQRDGRLVAATSILTEGRSYLPTELEAMLGEPMAAGERGSSHAEAADDRPRSTAELLASLSPKRRSDLDATEVDDRSAHFHKVTGWLKGDGNSQEEAVALWAAFPEGAGVAKYGNRLAQEVARVWNKVTDEPGDAGPICAASPSRPVDLWAKFDPPDLPAGILPSLIEDFARVEGEMMGADVGGLAAAALAVCAAAIPDAIKLQVKRHDEHWRESARLWVALIGTPSTKKSPILSAAVRPLARLDAQLYREYATALGVYQQLSKDEQRATTPPKQRRLRIEDTTIEAAQEVLKDSPDGVLCLQDELSGWFGAMDKYSGARGSAKDRGFWLQAFNGGTYAVNRVGRGAGFIENLSVSMLGGIQPEPLRKIAGDSVDDGLLQRLFPIVLRSASEGRDEPTPNVVSVYGGLVERLHGLRPPSSLGTGNLAGVLPVPLRFNDGAQAIRRDLERRHLALQGVEVVGTKLAAHIGKYDGLFARLCIVWHCVEHAFDERLPPIVTESTASRVATFLHQFLLPHAIAFYAGTLGLSDDHERLTAVAGYILAHKLEKVTNRDVQRGDRTMRGLTKPEIQRIFEQLDALGWLDQQPGPRPSDPPHWRVNPQCHQLFAKKAAEEGKRREKAREMILGIVERAA